MGGTKSSGSSRAATSASNRLAPASPRSPTGTQVPVARAVAGSLPTNNLTPPTGVKISKMTERTSRQTFSGEKIDGIWVSGSLNLNRQGAVEGSITFHTPSGGWKGEIFSASRQEAYDYLGRVQAAVKSSQGSRETFENAIWDLS